MTTFNISTPTNVGQSLIDSETGIVGPTGTIQVTSGSAVTMSDSTGLLVAGSLLTTNGSTVIGSAADRLKIVITEGANVVASGTGSASYTALFLPFGDILSFNNAGNVQSAFRGLDATGSDAFARFEVVNSGRIATDDEAVKLSATGTDATIKLTNSGDLVSNGTAVDIFGSVTTDTAIVNSGLMQGGTIGVRLFGGEVVNFVNTGTVVGQEFALLMIGDVTPSEIENSNAMIGDVVLVAGNDTLRNVGLIDGDVDLGAGDDVLNTRNGTVTGDILAGDGNDLVRGSQADDTIDGGNDNDDLWGYAGDDTLVGGSGFDTIRGGSGDDSIDGGGRSDLIVGGKGNDTMTGSGGADTFVIRRVGNGDDEITDFQNGQDIVDVSALGIQNFNAFNIAGALSNDTDAAVIDLTVMGGSGSIRLVGIQVADLDASDFIF